MKNLKVDPYDKWIDKYLPIKNYYDANASYDGLLHETYRKELEFVRQTHLLYPRTVWTLVEEDGRMAIIAGFYLVNRIGYFVTRRGWPNKSQPIIQINT